MTAEHMSPAGGESSRDPLLIRGAGVGVRCVLGEKERNIRN